MSASTSCNQLAEQVLQGALAGKPPDAAQIRALAQDTCSGALFRIVVEGLADRFEPHLCRAYVELFSEIVACVVAGTRAASLRERYARIRLPRLCTLEPDRVFLLSRVTLGADIAVTSVLLQAAKIRFPKADIVFVGSARNAELWQADARVKHREAPYPRSGLLRDRLEASRALAHLLDWPESIVLDPDSRLTQLGLLPVCPDERYFFFESRSWGGDSDQALPELAAQWCGRVLGVPEAGPFLALAGTGAAKQAAQAAVSFGVGENAAKCVDAAFERGVLQNLHAAGYRIVIDQGASAEEARRVAEAVTASGVPANLWKGSFAGFASHIGQSGLYAGYDSAGQHAAAALGVPLVTVFRGQVCRRMFERWKPTGSGPIHIVNAAALSSEEALRQTAAAIGRIRTA